MKIRKNIPTIKATRIFTDREEPRKAFWNRYNTVKNELNTDADVHVLNYYGVGGIGKSSLLKKIKEEMDEKLDAPKYISIDFKSEIDPQTVLIRMRTQLNDKYAFTFDEFDIGLFNYAQKCGEQADMAKIQSLSEKSDVLNLLLAAADFVPGASVVSKIFSAVDQVTALARNKAHLKKYEDLIKKLSYMERDQIYAMLPELFSNDINRNLENATEPLVIFIDTYELLVNELSTIGDPLMADKWLRDENGPVQNISKVLWVIAGREKLKWEKFDSDWSSSVESHILGDLSEKDSTQFLQAAGINDIGLCKEIYKLTKGTPVYLDLCVAQFENIQSKGEIPHISMFGKNNTDIIERFVRYMDKDQKQLVYLISCLKKWDDELFRDITEKTNLRPNLIDYDKLKDYSFVTASDDGYYIIHQTVGDVLRDKCPDTIRFAVGNALTEKFSETLRTVNVFSTEFSTALTYMAQAGLLLYTDRNDLCDFFKNEIIESLCRFYKAGRLEEARAVYDLLHNKAAEDSTDLLYAYIIAEESEFLILTGDYNNAYVLAEKSVELYTALLGEAHPDALKAIAKKAGAIYYLGRHNESLQLYQTVVSHYEEMFDETHPDRLDATNSLSVLYHTLGKHYKAVELEQFVLKIRRQTLGEDHPDTIKALSNMAITLGRLKKHDEALELKHIVLNKRKQILGEDHPGTIRATANLAATLCDLDRYDEALELEQTVLEKRRQILGEDHPDTIKAMSNMACTLSQLCRHNEALELRRTVLEKRRQILGDDHPDTVSSMSNLAATFGNLERYNEMLTLENAVLAKRRQLLGEDHPATINAMKNLAISYSMLDNQEDSLTMWQQVFEKRRHILGPDHPDTIDAMVKLSQSFGDLNRHDDKIIMEKMIIEKLSQISGEDHPDTINAMENLSVYYGEIDRHNDALVLDQKVYEKRRQLLGEDHPHTLHAKQNVAINLYNLSRYEESYIAAASALEKCRERPDDNSRSIAKLTHLIDILSRIMYPGESD